VDRSQIIAIPTAHRPELLALALEKLSAARNRPEVHIYADSVPESRLQEIEIVRDLYLPEAFLFRAQPHVKAPSGCWNILNAIKSAAQFADDVYLVEEDVLVYPYFFEWHQSQTAPVSCGRKIPRYDLYTNPGTCFRRPLIDALLPHICDEYFRNTNSYCAGNFKDQFISTLDDGLIRRVIHQNSFEWVFPPSPVCAHVGFRAYGRTHLYQVSHLPILERIERAREIIGNPNNTEVGDRYTTDWEAYRPLQ